MIAVRIIDDTAYGSPPPRGRRQYLAETPGRHPEVRAQRVSKDDAGERSRFRTPSFEARREVRLAPQDETA